MPYKDRAKRLAHSREYFRKHPEYSRESPVTLVGAILYLAEHAEETHG